jgi:hypothetical protein
MNANGYFPFVRWQEALLSFSLYKEEKRLSPTPLFDIPEILAVFQGQHRVINQFDNRLYIIQCHRFYGGVHIFQGQ